MMEGIVCCMEGGLGNGIARVLEIADKWSSEKGLLDRLWFMQIKAVLLV